MAFCLESMVPSNILVCLLLVLLTLSPVVALPRFFSNRSAIDEEERAFMELLLDTRLCAPSIRSDDTLKWPRCYRNLVHNSFSSSNSKKSMFGPSPGFSWQSIFSNSSKSVCSQSSLLATILSSIMAILALLSCAYHLMK